MKKGITTTGLVTTTDDGNKEVDSIPTNVFGCSGNNEESNEGKSFVVVIDFLHVLDTHIFSSTGANDGGADLNENVVFSDNCICMIKV